MPVEFNEQEFNNPVQMQSNEEGGVTKLILKIGLAKNAAQANVVMLVIAVIAIALAVYLILPSRTPASLAPITPTAGQVSPQGGP